MREEEKKIAAPAVDTPKEKHPILTPKVKNPIIISEKIEKPQAVKKIQFFISSQTSTSSSSSTTTPEMHMKFIQSDDSDDATAVAPTSTTTTSNINSQPQRSVVVPMLTLAESSAQDSSSSSSSSSSSEPSSSTQIVYNESSASSTVSSNFEGVPPVTTVNDHVKNQINKSYMEKANYVYDLRMELKSKHLKHVQDLKDFYEKELSTCKKDSNDRIAYLSSENEELKAELEEYKSLLKNANEKMSNLEKFNKKLETQISERIEVIRRKKNKTIYFKSVWNTKWQVGVSNFIIEENQKLHTKLFFEKLYFLKFF